ncbi:MAG: helix-turn-helix domain-containing GNAT family N-acetyltransferase [Pseudomonadales bacterium]|nr:helix-turn-helix domain-containing GNAT family N-acetyltransferase [Pseudomonadales bacterium]
MGGFVEELGSLALALRLKRLSDKLLQDGIKLYRQSGIAFEPKWFPVFYYLQETGPTSVTDLARGLGVTHPGINQISREMISAELVVSYKDMGDKRKRVLALTSKAKTMLSELEPVWRVQRAVLQEILDQAGDDGLLHRLEQVLQEKGLYQRFLDRYDVNSAPQIVTYDARYREAFARLNVQWISFYFELEDADKQALEDPERYIIDQGGEIFFALDPEGEVLGTGALMMHEDGTAELAKMAVLPSARGRGIGRLLGEAILALADARGLGKLFLETNRKLTPAIRLYQQLGFVERPRLTESEYGRADLYMER